MHLPRLPLVVLDTETTGFVPRVHRVIEYASVQVNDGKITQEYQQLFACKEVPPHVEILTRIRTEHLQDKPTFEEKREEVRAHIPEGSLIVGQNILFDIGMLKGEGIDLTGRPWIDTSMLASLVFPELRSYSLGYLSTVLRLEHDPPHRALGDVRATLALLSACWQRLSELPENMRTDALKIMQRSTPGYQMLFSVLPSSSAKTKPTWLTQRPRDELSPRSISLPIALPNPGTVDVVEEPLDPAYLHGLIRGSLNGTEQRWLAVKNLRSALRRFPADFQAPMKEGKLRILYPAVSLLDPEAAARLQAQENFTADESTLALKLCWYASHQRDELPVHGGEDAVWNGKLGCTEESTIYKKQFEGEAPLTLLDHRELLRLLESPMSPLPEKAHVIVDDASMLEDTATKAYGLYCSFDSMRAAAEGDKTLTQFLDTLQLWVEKTRQGQDIRYLAVSDVSSPDMRGLRDQLSILLQAGHASEQVMHALSTLDRLLNPENVGGRIVWIEQRQNGSQSLQSVPERIGAVLTDTLFQKHSTTLLLPPHTHEALPEILPKSIKSRATKEPPDAELLETLPLSFSSEPTLDDILSEPPPGKTIILLPGRGTIEDLYVKHTERLEARDTTLICLGVGGGQGRMQAEFLAAPAPALWLLTPWMFEGIELPAGTVDHLIMKTLPFDHPSHPVTSRRSQHYTDPFMDYCLPRLQHRLFRLLRTFCRMRTENGDARILDERLFTKKYGKTLREYLAHFAEGEVPEAPALTKPKAASTKTSKKKDPGQLSLF